MKQRKLIRLKGYDYALPGEYFVTVCTRNKQNLFGEIVDGKMIFYECGGIIEGCLKKIKTIYQNCNVDTYIIMPNHIHVIFAIVGAGLAPAHGDNSRATARVARTAGLAPAHGDNSRATATFGGQAMIEKSARATARVVRTGLSSVVGGFKSICVNEYRKYLELIGSNKSCLIWQRNYYERIIRDDLAYENIWKYIRDNPMNWQNDKLNKMK